MSNRVSGLRLVYASLSAGYERGEELPAQQTSNRRWCWFLYRVSMGKTLKVAGPRVPGGFAYFEAPASLIIGLLVCGCCDCITLPLQVLVIAKRQSHPPRLLLLLNLRFCILPLHF